jgi:O-antigen ligase
MKITERLRTQNIDNIVFSPFFIISAIIFSLLFFQVYLKLSALAILSVFFGLMLILVILVRPEIGLFLFTIYVLIEGNFFIQLPRFGIISIPIILEALLIMALAFKIFIKKEHVFRKQPQVIIFGLYFLLVLLSFLAASIQYSANLNYLREAILLPLISFFFFYAIIKKREMLFKLLFVLIIANVLILFSALLTILGIIEPEKEGLTFHGIQRLTGFIQDPNFLSFNLITFIILCFFLFLYFKSRVLKFLLLSLIIINLAAVLFTLSRGGFIALIGVLLFLYLKLTKNLKVFLILLLISAVLYIILPEELLERFAEVKSFQKIDRVSIAKIGMNMTFHYPIFGVGPGNFIKHFRKFSEGFFWTDKSPHNLFLSISSQIGLPALIVYLLFFFITWRKITHIENKHKSKKFEGNFELSISLMVKTTFINIFAMGLSLHIEHRFIVMLLLGLSAAFLKIIEDEEKNKSWLDNRAIDSGRRS